MSLKVIRMIKIHRMKEKTTHILKEKMRKIILTKDFYPEHIHLID